MEKYYIGLYKNNNFNFISNPFITSKDESVGQFISSNWFKEKLDEETITLILIKSKTVNIIPGKIFNVYSLERLKNLINANIINIFQIKKENIEHQIKQFEVDHRIDFEGLLNNDSTMSVAISKNKKEEFYICNPCYYKK